MENILVIDDDEEIRKLIKDFLKKENFEVKTVKNGKSAISEISKNPDKFGIAVLDIMLPDISGVEVCREIRKSSDIPIIMLTARSEDIDKIIGLEVGADDYLTKPFNPKELVARIKAILRRVQIHEAGTSKKQASDQEKIRISFYSQLHRLDTGQKGPCRDSISELLIIPKSRKVLLDNSEIKLTNKEYNLLLYFIENRDIVISRENLLESIWGYDFVGESRTIDVHVKELRKKIGDTKGNLIETIWSVGYRLNYDKKINSEDQA